MRGMYRCSLGREERKSGGVNVVKSANGGGGLFTFSFPIQVFWVLGGKGVKVLVQ